MCERVVGRRDLQLPGVVSSRERGCQLSEQQRQERERERERDEDNI